MFDKKKMKQQQPAQKKDTRFSDTMFSEANNYFFGKEEVSQSFVLLTGEIEDEKCTGVIAEILQANFSPKEERPEVINLIIQSPGGNLDSALALIATIMASKIPVRTVGLGCVGSAALCILMSGKQRMADKYCSFLSHQFSTQTGGTFNELDVAHAQMIRYYEKMCELYEECTGLPKKVIKKKLLKHEDVWLTPEEALEYNMLDYIGDMK